MSKRLNSPSDPDSSQNQFDAAKPVPITEDMLVASQTETKIDFERGMSYFPPLTLLLITANCVVFVWQMTTGTLESREAIIAAGALERGHLLHGEIWRLFSAMFLHGSLEHLLGNCLALYVLGVACEQALSFAQAGLVYLCAGLCASLLSVLMQPGPSVGASGAIFGLMAAIVVFLYRYQHCFFIRDRRIGGVIAAWGLYTIGFGFLSPYIDNFAHIGGALGGGVTLLLQKPALLTKRRSYLRG